MIVAKSSVFVPSARSCARPRMTVPSSMASCPTSSPSAWASSVESGMVRSGTGSVVIGGLPGQGRGTGLVSRAIRRRAGRRPRPR